MLTTSVYSSAVAATPSATPYATGSLKEAIYELPGDGGKCYLSVVGDSKDGSYQSLCKLFNETEDCKAVRDQYQYNELTKASKMYAARYSQDFKSFPTVRIQTPDGATVQEWSGRNIPANADLVAELKAECWRRHREKQQVEPDKQESQPVDVPPVVPQEPEVPLWFYGCVFCAGVAACLVHKLTGQVRSIK